MKDFMKKRKLCLLLPVISVIAAVVVFFAIGFAPDRFNDGYRVYAADLAGEVVLEDIDAAALAEDVKTAIGRDADVYVGYNYGTNKNELTVTVGKGESIDERAAVDMLAEKYAAFGIAALNSESFDGSNDSAYYYAALVIVGLSALLCVLLCAFAVGFADALRLLLCAVGGVSFVTLVYILARIQHFPLYIAASLACVLLVFAFGSIKCMALKKQLLAAKKPERGLAAEAVLARDAGSSFSTLILGALFAAAFVAVGFIMHNLLLVYIGAMFFAVVAATAYTAFCVVPALWSLSK